jgi:hypothetical protein
MATSSRSADGSAWTPVFVAVAVAWLGLFVHNAVEFPHMPLSRPGVQCTDRALARADRDLVGLRRHEWPAKLLFAWGAISLPGRSRRYCRCHCPSSLPPEQRHYESISSTP